MNRNFLTSFFYLIVAISFFLVSCQSVLADDTTVCGDVPLYLGYYSAPEILFIVDLSGSMAFGLRPDWDPVYTPDADPDTPGQQPYEGFYTDLGLTNMVFRRYFIWTTAISHFLVYPCYSDPDSIDDTPLTVQCTQDNGLYPVDPDTVFIDESLNLYGIADWNNSDYPYSIFTNSSHRICDPSQFPPYTYFHDEPCERYIPLLYEWDTAVLGNYLNTMRIEVISRTIQSLVQDSSLAIGLGFFKDDFGSSQDYTRIYRGVEPYSADHVNSLIEIINNIAHEPIDDCTNCYRVNVGGGTPFSPSIIAAKKYFLGLKSDLNGNYYSPGVCAKKFVIFLTDGVGNIDSTVDNVRDRTRELVQAGITPIAVGFNLPPDEDSQLRAMAEVANEEADGEETFALHIDQDNDGTPDPFIARNPSELTETLRSIIYKIKQTVFKTGVGAARKTEAGNMIIWTSFDVTDWTGEIRTGQFKYNCANCHNPDQVRSLARWSFYIDLDEDGHLDLIKEDLDDDGKLDTKYEDVNGNNVLDEGEDLDNDGHLDVPEDIDGDGHLDSPEPIDWDRLTSFLNDTEQIQSKMGSDALKGYSQSKIPNIIDILKGVSPDKDWWEIEEGWSSSQTLTCDNAASRNIKYGPSMSDFEGEIDPLSSSQVSFIRGERGCGTPDPDFRQRSYPLGDIIFSQPRVWKDLIWVTANDGMLHAFNVNTGEEVFAYIPSSVLQRYVDVGYFSIGYCHAFLFDNTPVIKTINDKDILVVGLGKGGPEYLALDITDAPQSVHYLWSFSDSDLGLATNPPKILKCGGDYAAIFTSGPPADGDWDEKKAYIYAVDLTSGSLITSHELSQDTANVPSVPGVSDIDGDGVVDYFYLGDLKGKIWRLKGCNFSDSCSLLDLGDDHPITTAPLVTSSQGKNWIFFGTGKYWDINDLSDSNSQFLVGFLDDPTTCNTPTLETIELDFSESGEYLLFDDSNNCTIKEGWKIELREGERVITSPIIVGGTVFFLTFVPTGDQCSGGGETWIYAVDYNKGCISGSHLDVNDDGKVNAEDLVDGKPVIGLKVGKGVPTSKPIIVGPNLMRITTTETVKDIIFKAGKLWIKKGSWTDVDVSIH